MDIKENDLLKINDKRVLHHNDTHDPLQYNISQYLRQDFYSLISITVERSCCIRIRDCGTGGF